MDGQLMLREEETLTGRAGRAAIEAAMEESTRNRNYVYGMGLRLIRGDKSLYKDDYGTFEEYCQARWTFTRAHAAQLITFADVYDHLKMSTVVDILPSAESHVRELAKLDEGYRSEVWTRVVDAVQRDGQVITAKLVAGEVEKKLAELSKTYITLDEWRALTEEDQRRALAGYASDKQMNQVNDNISWAAYSWNPVTGCRHGCEYCYASDIAARFYPQGFEPSFHPDRLAMPQNTRPSASLNRRVFVCSMADLFGDWVPQEWIEAVISKVRACPQWTFLFLTKNPARMVNIDWPDNAQVGVTVDCQARVEEAEKAFVEISAPLKFVSCEPLRGHVKFNRLDAFDVIIIGAQSKNSKCPERQPEWRWVYSLLLDAATKRVVPYWKPNLRAFPQEWPDA